MSKRTVWTVIAFAFTAVEVTLVQLSPSDAVSLGCGAVVALFVYFAPGWNY